MKNLLTPQELAAQTGQPVSRIRRLLKEGRLDYVPVGESRLLEPNALERMIERDRVQAPEIFSN
ncbi:helix-turn-helix domain-containing protein [Curvivirga aplysinae]|uniref:helix-turn-helix domain-containing protein n=1 Tax=Curvivirga aplysinae TaxID=2529852 RepID=UPI0012BBBD5D|nr:helix-turn-helix domain-containing protein [Curvivirga aplysinae]MTI11174.1 DNA-binding protein [Curvivirga aplysinae]